METLLVSLALSANTYFHNVYYIISILFSELYQALLTEQLLGKYFNINL